MLVKFAVTNYRGFAQRIEWNLGNPNNYEFNSFAVKNGIIKNGILYGPNGSGKTNFGLALFDIVNHLSQKWKKSNYYDNFLNVGNSNSYVKFEYTFKFEQVIVEYFYSKSSKGSLMAESLNVDGKSIFVRENEVMSIDDSSFIIDENVKSNLSNNANNISIVNFLLSSYPLPKEHYLVKLQEFTNSMLWFRCLETREFIGLETTVSLLDEYIIQNNLIDDFADFIDKVSGQEFSFVTPKVGDKALFCLINGSTVSFDLIASTGTQSLMLLYFWIKKMNQASFVFVDEFDAFYHFKLSYEVCKKLFEQNCQVFLSSHNTYLMSNDLLRPDCNFVINNNVIKSLSESTDKELREGHNIEKLYRGGTFQI